MPWIGYDFDNMKKQHKPEFIAEMKAVLEKELDKLTGALGRLTGNNGSGSTFPEYGDGEDENANEISDYSSNIQIENELEKAIRDIKQALERIANGTYGICKYTNELIEENRLRARPTSTSSIASKKTLTQEM